MQKENMIIYKLFKPVLGTLYKLYYNPKVIGKENIPKEGSIVVVGNHIHMMDQCNVITETKRPIHYMAKKEYFESKFAWFFRSVGCIPVDRSKKDDSATSSALEVLNNNQALGLFPEGTRNGLKDEKIKELYEKYMEDKMTYEEFFKKAKKNKTSHVNFLEKLMEDKVISKEEFLDNITTADDLLKDMVLNKRITKEEYIENSLLEFKFGAVSMAKKTNSKLVPFIITGEYKFRSKDLKVRIGKPIDPIDDLEEANRALREEMKKLMYENLEK